ncbi:MAG: hypothetical protein SGCHY_001993 [Lobulomycetales sp.]
MSYKSCTFPAVRVLGLWLLLAVAMAKPNGSPICTTIGAGPLIVGGMGPNALNLTAVYNLTSSTDALVPGGQVNVSALAAEGADPVSGFLIYASDAANQDSRVGSFAVFPGSKAADAGCGDFTLDAPESALTHSAPAALVNPSFAYTVPAQMAPGASIAFSAILVSSLGDGKYAWGVFPEALVLPVVAATETSCVVTETATVTATVTPMKQKCQKPVKKCRNRSRPRPTSF